MYHVGCTQAFIRLFVIVGSRPAYSGPQRGDRL